VVAEHDGGDKLQLYRDMVAPTGKRVDDVAEQPELESYKLRKEFSLHLHIRPNRNRHAVTRKKGVKIGHCRVVSMSMDRGGSGLTARLSRS